MNFSRLYWMANHASHLSVEGNLARRYGKLRRMLKIALPQLCISLCPGNKKASKILSSSHDNGSHRDERETPADFLPEIPFVDSEKKVKEKEVSDPSNEWKLYTDGASSPDGAGAGLMLIDPAEYEALLAGLRIAQEMEIMKVAIFLDSQLVVNQTKGTYATK
ncbi:reverse transcriptase domain-containing protein [Tanacetum coccineum]